VRHYTSGGVHRGHRAEACFVDGAKRTGFVVGVLVLELNGYRFTVSEEAAARAVLDLAAGVLDEAGYNDFLRTNSTPERRP
jgi:death on curing protein